MKSSAIITLGLFASVQGFAPAPQGRVGTEISESLFDRVFGMDLFAPKMDQNDYGARTKKNVSLPLLSAHDVEESFVHELTHFTFSTYSLRLEKSRKESPTFLPDLMPPNTTSSVRTLPPRRRPTTRRMSRRQESSRTTLISTSSVELTKANLGRSLPPSDTGWPRPSTTGPVTPTSLFGPRRVKQIIP